MSANPDRLTLLEPEENPTCPRSYVWSKANASIANRFRHPDTLHNAIVSPMAKYIVLKIRSFGLGNAPAYLRKCFYQEFVALLLCDRGTRLE